MGFLKISLLFLFLFGFFTLRASCIDEDCWRLSGAFFLNKKCYISIQDTRKSKKGALHNSLMMGVSCQSFIPQPQGIFPLKQNINKSYWLRYAACYNSFYYRQRKLSKLLEGSFYEVELLKDSDLRSIVVLALLEHLETCNGFMSYLMVGKILDLLGGERP